MSERNATDQPIPPNQKDYTMNQHPDQSESEHPHDAAEEAAPPPGGEANPAAAAGNAWFDDDEAAARPAARPRSVRTWIAGGVTAVVIAAGAMFGINAAGSHSSANATQSQGAGPGGTMGRGTQGTITSISGSTLTVKTSSGSTKVTTSASTAVSVAKAGAVADIATGDHVMVTGTTSGTKVAATQIVDSGKTASTSGQGPGGGQPPGGQAPAGSSAGASSGGGTRPSGAAGRPTSGTVTRVDGSTITVKGTDGTTYTVSTGSSTKVTVESTAKLSDLATGDTVQVLGQTSSGSAVAASRIIDGATTSFGMGGTPPSGSGGAA